MRHFFANCRSPAWPCSRVNPFMQAFTLAVINVVSSSITLTPSVFFFFFIVNGDQYFMSGDHFIMLGRH